MVKQALAHVQQACASTGRNQACYGYVSLSATPRTGAQNFSFSKAGDLADVADLASLQLTALDPAKNTWGIAMMKLQANLPDTLPGENVTFLMFGDVQIKNAVPSSDGTTSGTTPNAESLQPMQAFYFKSGVGATTCAGAPADGLLIQTPKGAGQISVRANNVDIQLGSTAYLQAQPGTQMNVKVVEGKGHLTAGGKTVVVPAGAQVDIPLDEDLNASGEPSDPEAYDASELEFLPIDDLPDEITIAPPADEEALQQAMDEAETEMESPSGDTETELTNPSSDEQPTDAGEDQPPDDNPPDDSGG
jgi:hypothetical protein